jgi:Flp pilus assembly pilin Flp
MSGGDVGGAVDGPTAVEYAVMLALLIVVCIGTITTTLGP